MFRSTSHKKQHHKLGCMPLRALAYSGYACWTDEDYIGQVCRIARRLNAGSLVVQRTMTRSLMRYQRYFDRLLRQHWNLRSWHLKIQDGQLEDVGLTYIGVRRGPNGFGRIGIGEAYLPSSVFWWNEQLSETGQKPCGSGKNETVPEFK